MKEAARGSAALATLPSREELGGAYLELRERLDQIVRQAEAAGSLAVAIQGLNTLRQSLDSLAKLAGHERPVTSQVTVDLSINLNASPGCRRSESSMMQREN
jgi:hypothetical protein